MTFKMPVVRIFLKKVCLNHAKFVSAKIKKKQLATNKSGYIYMKIYIYMCIEPKNALKHFVKQFYYYV